VNATKLTFDYGKLDSGVSTDEDNDDGARDSQKRNNIYSNIYNSNTEDESDKETKMALPPLSLGRSISYYDVNVVVNESGSISKQDSVFCPPRITFTLTIIFI
jgi:hypothetical protein